MRHPAPCRLALPAYRVVPLPLAARVQPLATRLGFPAAPDDSQVSGYLSWTKGSESLSAVQSPLSVKYTSTIAGTTPGKIPTKLAAEQTARTYIQQQALVPAGVSLALKQASYVNSDGRVFAPVTDPTKPTLVRLDFVYQIDGNSVFFPQGYPAGIQLLVSDMGVAMFSADLIVPVSTGESIVLNPIAQALQDLRANKGTLVNVEKELVREGTTRETSFTHFSVSSTMLGYIWHEQLGELLPCYVFTGKAVNGEDEGAVATYIVSAIPQGAR